MWYLFCYSLFIISPSFGASGRLCLLIVAFPGCLHLRFFVISCVHVDFACLPHVPYYTIRYVSITCETLFCINRNTF